MIAEFTITANNIPNKEAQQSQQVVMKFQVKNVRKENNVKVKLFCFLQLSTRKIKGIKAKNMKKYNPYVGHDIPNIRPEKMLKKK